MRTSLAVSFLLFLPVAVSALQLNEIMYDLPGSDSGREWIEVYQDGADCINLTQWKIFEANTNHGITLSSENGQLCANGYAIISDNPANFLADHVDFAGSLFDSSFSLSNTGEAIALKNPEGNVTDSVAYSAGWGASGNGRSLERNASGWFESLVNSTPGIINSIGTQQSSQQSEQNQIQQNQQNSSAYNPPSNYSPLIDFSIIARSNHVPPGSAIEVVVSVVSNYLVGREVSFCSYVTAESSASDEACRSVSLAPDETRELRLYNTLKNVSGNLTLVVELRDGVSVKQKTANLEVLSPKTETVKAPVKDETGPTGAFATEKADWLSQFIAWLKEFFSIR